MNSKQKIILNSTSSLLTKVINFTLLLWLQQYLLKNISIEEYSIYPVIMSLMIFVALFKIMISGGIARFITLAYVDNNQERVTSIVSVSFLINLLGSVLIFILGVLIILKLDLILNIDTQYFSQAKIMLVILLASFISQLLATSFEMGLFITEDFIKLNLIRLVETIIRIILLILLITNFSPRVLWVVVSNELSIFIGTIIRIILSKKKVKSIRFLFISIDYSLVKSMFSFNIWLFIGQLSKRLYQSVDVLILNKYSNALNITNFHIGSIVSKQLDELLNLILVPLYPALTKVFILDNKKKISLIYTKICRYSLWFYFFIATPIILFRYQIILLYVGAEYLEASKIILLLLIQNAFIVGNSLLATFSNITLKIKTYSIRLFAIQILNLILTLYFVNYRHMGSMGSALATLLANLIFAPMLYLPILYNVANVRILFWLKKTFLPGILPSIICITLLFRIVKLYAFDSWIKIFIGMILVCFIYLIVIIIIASKIDDDIIIIKAYVKKILKK